MALLAAPDASAPGLAVLPGPRGDAAPVTGAQLAAARGDVVLPGTGCDEQRLGILRIGVTVCHEAYHLDLPIGERRCGLALPGRDGEPAQEPHCDLWADQRVTSHRRADRLDQQRRAGPL